MSKNQFRFRLLIVAPATLWLLWVEGLLNTDPAAILFIFLVILSFLLVVLDIRANKLNNTLQHLNNTIKE